jgi:hypothetical protein
LWRQRAWGPLTLLLGWSGTIYLFLAGIPYQNFRYGLSLYPPLVLLASDGVVTLLERGRWRRVVLGMALVSLAGMLAWAYPMLDGFLTVRNENKAIALRAAQVVPEDATLLTFGLTLTVQHYTDVDAVDLFFLDPEGLQARIHSGADLYLLLDPNNVEQQWQGRPPAINYHWLQRHAGLIPIERWEAYQLYRVREVQAGASRLRVAPLEPLPQGPDADAEGVFPPCVSP